MIIPLNAGRLRSPGSPGGILKIAGVRVGLLRIEHVCAAMCLVNQRAKRCLAGAKMRRFYKEIEIPNLNIPQQEIRPVLCHEEFDIYQFVNGFDGDLNSLM